MSDLKIEAAGDGVVFTVKIVPASSRTCICGTLDGKLKVRVSALPEKGEANLHLIDFLAKLFDIKKNQINIISGQNQAVKTIKITGISPKTVLEKIDISSDKKGVL